MTTTTDAGKTGRQTYTENVLRQLIRLDRAGDSQEMALAVQAILETLGHYALADRAFLFNLTEGGRTFRNSFEWCRSGVSTQQGNLQDIAPEEIPVWMETFRSGSSIVIRDLEDVRETSPSEYALMKPQNIRREIASPIFYKGTLGGFLGLDNPGIEDTKSLVELLQLVGSHFGSSLENTRMVTALKRSVEDLRREQQILNVLCEDYTAVYRADLLNDRASVVKMSRNSNIYEIQIRNQGEDLPYTAFLQEYCADYVVPEDRERLLRELLPENLRQTLKKQRRVLIHYRGRPNKNGREFFEVQVTRLDTAHGECKALIGFHHIDDIVRENRKHQEELEKALMEATLNNEIVSAISKIYVAIYRIDLKQDFYEEISSEQSIHRLTGMAGKASSQMNTLCNTFVVPEYHDRVKKFFDLKTLPERMTHEETIAIEYPATDGNWHLARFIAKNRDKDGTVTKVLYVTQLISDEKRREQFWIVAAEEANQANAAKSAFLSRMSHDIRTPMNVIMGLVSIAQNHLGDPDRVRDSLEKIQTTGRNLQQLVNDVLDIGQIESGEFKIRAMPMDLNELIADLRETLQSTAPERGIKWECKVHDLVRNWVCSDSLRLSQVFTNLISNAVKYTPEGGAVALEFFEEPAEKPDRVRFVGIVRDTGIGMTSEFMKDMYQEFSRAVDTRVNKIRGSGLGLAIVKRIVDMMNGDISVDSHPGRGSVFRVTLEMEYLDKAPVEETPAEADNGRCDGLRLLIAEDGDLSYEIEAELLEDRGAKCTRAENGQRCVELFRDAPAGTFDAILMDMQMPVMDGPNAARAIRALDRPDAKTIPIIALTANAYREDVDVCVAAGMNAHLAKPLSVDKVVAALRKYQKQKDHT